MELWNGEEFEKRELNFMKITQFQTLAFNRLLKRNNTDSDTITKYNMFDTKDREKDLIAEQYRRIVAGDLSEYTRELDFLADSYRQNINSTVSLILILQQVFFNLFLLIIFIISLVSTFIKEYKYSKSFREIFFIQNEKFSIARSIWKRNRDIIQNIIRSDTMKERDFEDFRKVGGSQIISSSIRRRNNNNIRNTKNTIRTSFFPTSELGRRSSPINITLPKTEIKSRIFDIQKIDHEEKLNRGRRKNYIYSNLKLKKKNFGFKKIYLSAAFLLILNIVLNVLIYYFENRKF